MMHRLRVKEKEKRPQDVLVELHDKDVSACRRTGASSKNVGRMIFTPEMEKLPPSKRSLAKQGNRRFCRFHRLFYDWLGPGDLCSGCREARRLALPQQLDHFVDYQIRLLSANRLFPDTKFTENLPEQLLGINLAGDFSDGVERAPEVDGDEFR